MPLFVNAIENVSHTIMEGVKQDSGCIVPAAEGRDRFGQYFCCKFLLESLQSFLFIGGVFFLLIFTDTPVAVSQATNCFLIHFQKKKRLLIVSSVFFFTTAQKSFWQIRQSCEKSLGVVLYRKSRPLRSNLGNRAVTSL